MSSVGRTPGRRSSRSRRTARHFNALRKRRLGVRKCACWATVSLRQKECVASKSRGHRGGAASVPPLLLQARQGQGTVVASIVATAEFGRLGRARQCVSVGGGVAGTTPLVAARMPVRRGRLVRRHGTPTRPGEHGSAPRTAKKRRKRSLTRMALPTVKLWCCNGLCFPVAF